MTEHIQCSRCHMKFINDDEHIKNDFGYNRLNERYKQCVRCRTHGKEKKKEYRAMVKEEMQKTGEYISHRQKQQDLKKHMNEIIICDVCGCAKPRRLMEKHTNTPLCKRNANIKRYEELHGSTYTCMYKKIANGDIDFDGVIKLNDNEKRKSPIYDGCYCYSKMSQK